VLEFDLDKHRRLKDLCAAFGVIYSCSVWDVISAHQIASLHPVMIKVPSAQNLNWRLLRTLVDEYSGEIHISLGMTTRSEEESLVDFVSKSGRGADVVLYSCTSAYPVEDQDVCLLEISRLREAYGAIVKEIGFSGHHLGIAMDSAATALGAEWIERHFTLNRAWRGTDHAASLEPEAMRQTTIDARSVSRAMRYKDEGLLDVELPQRAKLKALDGA
jgi:N-acetylneuraminate synthase